VVLADTLTEEAVEHTWINVSGWYSILSVSAKLVLEWRFIALLATADANASVPLFYTTLICHFGEKERNKPVI